MHRLAAAIVLHQRGRLDLLKWLPAAVNEKKEVETSTQDEDV